MDIRPNTQNTLSGPPNVLTAILELLALNNENEQKGLNMTETATAQELLITVYYHFGQREQLIKKCLDIGCTLGGSVTDHDDSYHRVLISGTPEQKDLIDAFPETDIISWRNEE